MNCRGPTATPSVLLPAVETETSKRTSSTFHSGGQSCVFCGFRSAPVVVGSIKFLQEGRLTIVDVPLVCHASISCRACRGSSAPRCVLHARTIEKCGPSAYLLVSNRWEGACGLLSGNVHSCFCCNHPESETAFEGTVNISLLCTTILGHRWESLLLNVGQGSVLPSCRCGVLGKKVTRCSTYCILVKHSKTVFHPL